MMLVLAILGLVFTIMFGLISIILYVRRKKYPKRIKTYLIDMVRIWNPEVDKYKNIQITHSNQKISESVSYIKGLFCGDGDEDIDVAKKIVTFCHIELPTTYKWLEVHRQESSPNLKVDFTIDSKSPNILNVGGTLIKRDEIFCFDGFYEGKGKEKDVKQILKVTHRLPNTDISRFQKLIDVGDKKKMYKMYIIPIYIVLLLFMVIWIGAVSSQGRERSMIYKEKFANDSISQSTLYCAHMVALDSVCISQYEELQNPLEKRTISMNQFCDEYVLTSHYNKKLAYVNFIEWWVMIVFLILSMLGFVYLFIQYIQNKKVLKRYRALSTSD